MRKWLRSTAVLTICVIISIGILEFLGILSLSSAIKAIDYSNKQELEIHTRSSSNTNKKYAQFIPDEHNTNLYKKNCDFLIYQCAVGNDWEIRDMFKWSHPWIITVRDYAKKHNYCYKFDIFDKMYALSFLNENKYQWSQQRFVLIKTFGLYCLEYAILKYSPKWLLYLDIDVAIPPQTFYKRTLESILSDIQSLYNINKNTFYNDVTFIGQDLKYTFNSGIMFINNNHNNYTQTTHKQQDKYDVIAHWNDTKYEQFSQLLMSPKLQQFFDRIKAHLHHREYSLFYGYDQVVLQDVILFYANFGYLKKLSSMHDLTDRLMNKNITDDEYEFYGKECLQYKIVRQHNNCYWGSLNQWGYPFGERQFPPIVLVSEHKYRMNMHNNYKHGDIFLHN
eukprot:455284_1